MNNKHLPMYFVNGIKPFTHCGKQLGVFVSGGAYKKPYSIIELKQWKHNLSTCQTCKKNHKDAIDKGRNLLMQFPNCCEFHEKLNSQSWFDKNDFDDFPNQYADKLLFSWFHILEYLDTDDWKKEIFDYLEYVIDSFGSFPPSYGSPVGITSYFYELNNFLEQETKSDRIGFDELNKRKKEVKKYLESFYIKNENIDTETDINVLSNVYNEWFKTFPFELSFFIDIKPRFENILPVSNGIPYTNKYLGRTIYKLYTKKELINFLLKTTNNILTEINSLSLYEKGFLTEPDNVKMELVVNQRKMQLKKGYQDNSKTEYQQFRKILKQWFKDEKKFIDEITPLLSKSQNNVSQDKLIWKSTHALREFYNKVNNNFFEQVTIDEFFNAFTESTTQKLNAINYKQPDIGYLLMQIKPFFIEKIQADYNQWLSDTILFNSQKKNKKAVNEIINFHNKKPLEYKNTIDEIIKSITPYN